MTYVQILMDMSSGIRDAATNMNYYCVEGRIQDFKKDFSEMGVVDKKMQGSGAHSPQTLKHLSVLKVQFHLYLTYYFFHLTTSYKRW